VGVRAALTVALMAALELALVLAGGPTWATIPCGLAMALVLPGYVWFRVFSGTRAGSVPQATPLRAALISTMTSLGIVMVTGLVLNALPAGLTAHSWAIALAIIVAAGLVALAVRARTPGAARTGDAAEAQSEADAAPDGSVTAAGESALAAQGGGDGAEGDLAAARRRAPRPATVAKCLAAAGCVVGAGVISLSTQHTENASEHFTALSLNAFTTPRPTATIVNHQGRATSYTLTVTSNGRVAASQKITLASGGRFTKALQPYVLANPNATLITVTVTYPGLSTPLSNHFVTVK